MAYYSTGDNNFGVAKWIVDATAGHGTHTTIAAALTQAASGDTIFIRPGTYTENLTLKAGVNLSAFVCDALNGNVTISGKATFTAAGTVNMSGIRLQTNSDFFLAVTGSAASIVNLKGCYLNATNNTGISFTTSSSSAVIGIFECEGDLGTTGIAMHSSSSAGRLSYENCFFTNSGSSTTVTSNSAGSANFFMSNIAIPIGSTSTGGITAIQTYQDLSSTNTICITANGSGSSVITSAYVGSGTASSITIGTGATVLATNVTTNSSNANPITGAGSITYSAISHAGSGKTINTTTQTGGTLPGLKIQAPSNGFLGEQISSGAIGPIALTSTVIANITSISLTPGVWDITGIGDLIPSVSMTAFTLGMGTTSASFAGGAGGDNLLIINTAAASANAAAIPAWRQVVTTTTTYYLCVQATFTVTCAAYGRLSATRVG